MSRSRKKYPIGTPFNVRSKEQKNWKQECHRTLRRLPIDMDIPNGSKYKKYSGEIWNSPFECKLWRDNEKGYRK